MLVRESLSFEKHRDPKVALGIATYKRKAQSLFPENKIAFYFPLDEYEDTGEFEYEGKKFKITNSENLFDFLRSIDILIYVKDLEPLGYKRTKGMTYYSTNAGIVLKHIKDYRHLVSYKEIN